MSGRSCAGSVRSGAGSVRLSTPTSHVPVLDALYDRKRDNKSVRVLTVIIYVFCVSLAAIMLSLYYVFFWEPKGAQYAQRKVAHLADTTNSSTTTTPQPTCLTPTTTERSNITLNETMSASLSSETTIDVFNSTRPPDPTDVTDSSTEITFEDATSQSTTNIYNETNAT